MNVQPGNGLASWLLSVARRVLPRQRRDWGEAMDAEFLHLPPGDRLGWASGCLLAAIKQRLSPMNTGSFRINRWIMLVEVLGCFATALLAWWEFTFGPSGVVRLNGEIIDKYFLSVPGGGYVLGLMIGFSISGLVAPIGLFLGLRYVMLGRALDNRVLGYSLIALPVLQSLAGAIGMFVNGTDGWGVSLALFVLCTLLPVACILHLMYLATPQASESPGARLAAA